MHRRRGPLHICWLHLFVGRAAALFRHGNEHFFWDDVPAMATCQTATLSWTLSNTSGLEDSEMAIFIANSSINPSPGPTNGRGPIDGALFGRRCRNSTASSLLAVSRRITPGFIHPSAGSFVWSSVNVSEGWYMLLADLPESGLLRRSPTFFVTNGTDVSCLVANNQQTPASGFVASTHEPFATMSFSSSPSATLTQPSAASPLSGTMSLTAGAASSTSAPLRVGIVAGGVLGGMAAIACGIALCLFVGRRSAKQRRWAILPGRWEKPSPSPDNGPTSPPILHPEYPDDRLRPFGGVARSNSITSEASYATFSTSNGLPSPSMGRNDWSFTTAPSPAYASGASLELADDTLSALASVQDYNAVDPSLRSQPSFAPLIPHPYAQVI
uniref:Uncharacterized protein n=1 Tax=Mycena chlorophos TaxID=658473 RepID=A0ABQ0LCH7_MYCCL|nr:predicted protein [Mycena chlorophos]